MSIEIGDYMDEPTCPECGRGIVDWWDGISASQEMSDGVELDFTCPHCDTDFRVVVSVQTTFATVTGGGA